MTYNGSDTDFILATRYLLENAHLVLTVAVREAAVGVLRTIRTGCRINFY